ncbi:MAG: ABC transporter substrate-binding protein [Pseudomonadota bacterium]
MAKRNLSILGGVLLLCLSLLVTSCAKKEEAKEPYKVGCIFSITGPASWLGEPERRTAVWVEETVNAAGGINGHPLKLLIEDTKGDPTAAVLAAKKLLKEGVLAIVGPSRSGSSMAVVPIMEEAEQILVSCAAAEAIVHDPNTDKERKWIFKTPQKDSHVVQKILGHMKEKGISKIAIITGTTGFGALGREQLKKYAPEFNIEIVADETYGPKDTDMTVQLTKIKGTDAQAIVNWSIVPAQITVMKNRVQLSIKIPLYQSHGFGNAKYAAAAGEAAEGVIFPCGRVLVADALPDDHPQKKLLAEYKAAYESQYKEDVSTFGGHALDALNLVVAALKASGPDKEKMRSFIENTKGFVGTGGIFNFSPDDHTGLGLDALEMLTVRNGKFDLYEK